MQARAEFFAELKPGDHFTYNYEKKAPEEYVVVGRKTNLSVRAYSLASGKAGIFWHNDPKIVPVEIPEHHELHTDVGAYDEGYDPVAEEDRLAALSEGYDPSLDLEPLTEQTGLGAT